VSGRQSQGMPCGLGSHRAGGDAGGRDTALCSGMGQAAVCSQRASQWLGWVQGAVGWLWVQTLAVLPLGPRQDVGAEVSPLAWLCWQEGRLLCWRTSPAANPSLHRAAVAACPGFTWEEFFLLFPDGCLRQDLPVWDRVAAA